MGKRLKERTQIDLLVQTQPRSQGLSSLPPLSVVVEKIFSTTMEAEKRDPGNEVVQTYLTMTSLVGDGG